MMSYALVYQSVPPILSLVINDLGLSHTQAGMLTSAFAIPGIVVAVPAGMLAGLYGPRLIGSAAFVVLTTGAFIAAFSQSYSPLLLGRLVAGCGAMTLMVILPQLLGQWFHGRGVGFAMGAFHSAFTFGAIVVFNLYSHLAATFGWNLMLLLSALIAALGLVLFATLVRPSQFSATRGSHAPSLRAHWPVVVRRLWPLALAWLWLNAAMLSMFTFTPDALVQRGWTAGAAGRLTSMVLWPALFLTPISGMLVDRTRRKLVFAVGGSCFVIAGMLGLSHHDFPVWVAVLLLGLGVSFVPSTIYALPNDLVPPQALNLAFALLICFQNLGVTFGPFVAGRIRDATGDYTLTYLFLAALAVMIPLSTLAVIPIQSRLRRQAASPGAKLGQATSSGSA